MPIRWRGLKPPRRGAGAALPPVRVGALFATARGSDFGFFVSRTSLFSFLAGATGLLRVARARRAAAASVVSSFSSFLPIVEKKLGRFLVGAASGASSMAVWVGTPFIVSSCIASLESWSVVSPVTSTGRLRPLRLLRLVVVGLPDTGGVPLFCSWLMTDLH